MNIAVIFAGGTGERMNSKSKPKQFLELHKKPILIYTLEHFENHPEIDKIIIICLEDWIPYCKKLLNKFYINKVTSVIPGGNTGFESRFKGLKKAIELYPRDSVILMHDGVRPLIDETTISNAILCVKQNGSAITVAPAMETITIKSEDNKVGNIFDRSKCQLAKAPQCFLLGELFDAHKKGYEEGLLDSIDSASLMRHYGHTLYTVECGSENIKITTPTDFYIFRAIIDARENSQIFG